MPLEMGDSVVGIIDARALTHCALQMETATGGRFQDTIPSIVGLTASMSLSSI
jgi:hypothetical protein